MNLAIMLLVVIAIASVTGTILQQNQPFQDYIIKFGPFWHEVYDTLGLYDVYSSIWFMGMLAFLVLTVSVCILRNGPHILRSMRKLNVTIPEQSLSRFPNHSQWQSSLTTGEAGNLAMDFLKSRGYRTKTIVTGEQFRIAGMKGSANRIGYLLTHIAIIVICIGGLLDGNLALKLMTLQGEKKIETRDIPVSEIPEHSRISADNPAFRASVLIPEGARVNYAFINLSDGYLLQYLPFSIHVKDFRIEHYATGQPKSFMSDLVIDDPKAPDPVLETISVNNPLLYKGYSIYQSSFSDGGSVLDIRLHEVFDNHARGYSLKGIINEVTEVTQGGETLRIEFEDFRRFNIFPDESGETEQLTDYGPSFTYKVRKIDGTAHEYINYMYPVNRDGNMYFISGMRDAPDEEFHYLYIPADDEFSLEQFLQFQAIINDEDKSARIISQSLDNINLADNGIPDNVSKAVLKLLALFRSGGLDEIQAFYNRDNGANPTSAGIATYIKLLQAGLQLIYLHLLAEAGHDISELTAAEQRFFEDSVIAMSAFHHYRIPFYLELEKFDHKQATGLQITRTPGKKLVYIGFFLLVSGVFLLFYIHHERIWVFLSRNNQGTSITVAGSRAKYRREFTRKFRAFSDALRQATTRGADPL